MPEFLAHYGVKFLRHANPYLLTQHFSIKHQAIFLHCKMQILFYRHRTLLPTLLNLLKYYEHINGQLNKNYE
jgi:hypothetical protein